MKPAKSPTKPHKPLHYFCRRKLRIHGASPGHCASRGPDQGRCFIFGTRARQEAEGLGFTERAFRAVSAPRRAGVPFWAPLCRCCSRTASVRCKVTLSVSGWIRGWALVSLIPRSSSFPGVGLVSSRCWRVRKPGHRWLSGVGAGCCAFGDWPSHTPRPAPSLPLVLPPTSLAPRNK